MTQLTVIALGWGRQSWTLAAMSALGILPRADLAIHADTGWERTPTRRFAAQWTPWLETHGLPVATAHPKDTRVCQGTAVMLPTYTVRRADGKQGRSPRQCTRDWKVRPQKRLLRNLMRQRHIKLLPATIEKWLGFTTDEANRQSDPPIQYITHRYPLIELGMSRSDTIAWLQEHNLGVPPKSACIVCPFRNDPTWHEIRTHQPDDWHRAVLVDHAIRKHSKTHDLYLHRSRQPLDTAITQGAP